LTQVREELFDTLIRAAVAYGSGLIHLPDHLCTSIPFNNSKHTSHNHLRNKIEIRIAGGWVRDKILQQESHDIDVTLNCMSGHAFATLVQAYLVAQASFAIPNTDNNTVSPPSLTPKIAVISANAAQSKHLETATMKILGMDIDFTNLRAEELYQADSRIPTTQLGTPKEDAYRRDFTVNSLFYNIQTQQIEDWTGRGVQDLLYHKQLVTPLNAHITFSDDPLRVLRAIRFSARYHLPLHPDIW
jgi:tRNA nucleotidyltransferase (CCA-adding enzyme)